MLPTPHLQRMVDPRRNQIAQRRIEDRVVSTAVNVKDSVLIAVGSPFLLEPFFARQTSPPAILPGEAKIEFEVRFGTCRVGFDIELFA
jgi:hypothetical protein